MEETKHRENPSTPYNCQLVWGYLIAIRGATLEGGAVKKFESLFFVSRVFVYRVYRWKINRVFYFLFFFLYSEKSVQSLRDHFQRIINDIPCFIEFQ